MKKCFLLLIAVTQLFVISSAWGSNILFSNLSSVSVHGIAAEGRLGLYPGARHIKGDALGTVPGRNYFSKTPIRDDNEQFVCTLGAAKQDGHLKVWVEDANGVHIGPQHVIRDAFNGETTYGLQLPVPADQFGRKINVRVKWWLHAIGWPIHDISFEIIDA